MHRGIFIVLIGWLTLSLCVQDTSAQESDWGLSVNKLFMDYQGLDDGSVIDYRRWTGGFELGAKYRLNRSVSLYAPVKVGVIDVLESNTNTVVTSLDAQVHYHFLSDTTRVHPYLLTGVGVSHESPGETYPSVPVGLGVGIEIFQHTDFNARMEYRKAFEDDRDNVQFSIGFTHYFARPSPDKKEVEETVNDSDKDGIPDDLDLCPQKPGPEKFQGCPDSDDDGIPDYKDRCEEIAGLMEFNGCPDSDDDGIPDPDDECPNVPGNKANNGCPEVDSDGDGLTDDKDDCPDEPGPENTNGCPDSDGDGVPDKEDVCPDVQGLIRFDGCLDSDGDGLGDHVDRCPNSPGPESNEGCPELEEEEKELLDIAAQSIHFDLGKATIKRESFGILDEIASLMKRYPDYLLRISGHTDNIGSEQANQKLSEQRARSCYEYLHAKGVSLDRMSYLGHGESKPIRDNATEEGRSDNRRVEFELYID